MRKDRAAIMWVFVATGMLMGQALLLPPARGGLLEKTILDAGHVPLFAAVAFVLLASARRMSPRPSERPYWLAFAVVVLLGLISEYLQGWVGRDAELMDFVRNLLGGACCLLVVRALDRKLPWGRGRMFAALGLSLFLLGLALAPLASLLDGIRRRDQAFPVLFDFDHSWEEAFLSTRGTEIEFVDAATLGGHGRALRLRFRSGEYPALILSEPVARWADYERLVFESYCDSSMVLNIRVDDAGHDGRYQDRFNRGIHLDPGHTRVEILLAEIQAAPVGRSMDLGNIRSIAFFGTRPGTVVIDRLRLE